MADYEAIDYDKMQGMQTDVVAQYVRQSRKKTKGVGSFV